MESDKAGFSTMFRGLKDIVVDHFKTTWSPFERTEGNTLIKDIFANPSNIQKLGLRVLHVALAALLGLNALNIVAAIVVSSPIALNVLIGLTCAGFVGGVALSFFPDQVNDLINMVAKQIQKLRDLCQS